MENENHYDFEEGQYDFGAELLKHFYAKTELKYQWTFEDCFRLGVFILSFFGICGFCQKENLNLSFVSLWCLVVKKV